MRYTELNIQTLRQPPARARSEGAALLRRAGYVDRDGAMSLLGTRIAAQLNNLARIQGPAQFFPRLEIPVLLAEHGDAFFPLTAGRVEIVRCSACRYAESRDLARFAKMEGEPEPLLPMQRVPTPESNTIEALARYLEVPKAKTAKALMYTRTGDARFVLVVIRGDLQLSEHKLKDLVGEVRLATTAEILAAGATPGYASPIGLKDALIVVDDLIPHSPNLVAGANEPGYHLLNTNYGRDYTAQIVADLAMVESGALCPHCRNALALMNAERLAGDDGYCIESILEALAETHHDERGLALPAIVAPFQVYLLHLTGKQLDTYAQAAELHDEWERAGISVLFDDRDERAGVKFADADLIGLPLRATVGERGMRDGMVELKPRTLRESSPVAFADALSLIRSLTKTSS